jgi:hypothetical protein
VTLFLFVSSKALGSSAAELYVHCAKSLSYLRPSLDVPKDFTRRRVTLFENIVLLRLVLPSRHLSSVLLPPSLAIRVLEQLRTFQSEHQQSP